MNQSWTRAAVALGSNLEDRAGHLDGAVRAVRALPGVRVLAVSDWIETDAVGGPPDSPRYLNGALVLETSLAPRELLAALQSIERAHGRKRRPGVRDEPRTLDLDLLVFGDRRIDEPGLTLPHPRLEQREFVLAPLAQVAPDLRLTSGRTPAEILAAIPR